MGYVDIEPAIQTGDLDVAICPGRDDPGGEPIVWATSEGFVCSYDAPVSLMVLDRSCY